MPYKILVVEDDPTIQRELVTLLQAEGYEAAAVVDFSTTLSQVNTVQPHLILLDIKLPGQSGFSLCSQIRAFSTVPIIFVTAVTRTWMSSAAFCWAATPLSPSPTTPPFSWPK